MFLILIIILVVGIIFLLITAFSSQGAGQAVRDRLSDKEKETEEEKEKKEKEPLTHLLMQFRGRVGEWVSRIEWDYLDDRRDKIENLFIQSGDPGQVAPDEFIAGQIMLSIAMLLVVGLFISNNAVIVLLSMGAGFYFPEFRLKGKIKQYKKEIFLALPDVLDLMTLSVEAGLDFSASINRIIEKSEPNALLDEFQRMQKEVSLGKSRERALKDMSNRLQIAELDSVLNSLVQALRLGSSIGPIVRRQAEQMRAERFQRAEKLAAEAPIKMLFPLLVFIFPTVFLILFGPIALQFVTGGGL
ncbi:MAG: type II secretion system F family protein [Elusimicrobiota bacterium]